MLDYQRIVEELQAALLSQGALDWDLLRDVAAEYATACEEVNERLAECQRLVRRGLRSEALQSAEREPNLLDSVAFLDFPELEQWRQLLAANGMVLPPLLRIDVASDLNAAYAAEAPLQALLKTHRLLALARAPLPARIDVLRRIQQADSSNPVWAEDLRALESGRQHEIQRELDDAIRTRNVLLASSLVEELGDVGWSSAPPVEVFRQARRSRDQLAAVLAAEEMQRIEPELSSAHAALDVEAGRAARSRWLACREVARLTDGDPLVRRAAPAITWLAEQDQQQEEDRQFVAAVANLERALEKEEPRAALERLFHAARRYQRELPTLLVRRYEERIRSFDAANRRRFTLAATALVGVLIVVGGATAWLLHQRHQDALAHRSAEALRRLVDEGSLGEAERYFEDFARREPVLAQRPQVQQEVGRLHAMRSTEADRQKAFEEFLSRSQQAGLDTPDRASLLEAERLALTADEKIRVAEWKTKLDAQDRLHQRRRDEQFEVEFRQLLADVEALEQEAQRSAVVDSAGVQQTLARLDALNDRSGGVATALSSQLKPLRLRLTAINRQMAEARRRQAALDRLTATIGNIDAYQAALESYVKDHDDSPLAAEFRRIMDEAQWWKGMQRWNAYLSHPRFADLRNVSPKEANSLLETGEVLFREAGDVPLAAHYQQRRAYLQGVANRIDEAGKPRDEAVRSLFQDTLVSGLWVLETTAGERHYLLTEPQLDRPLASGRLLFKVVTGFDLSERNLSVPLDSIRQAGLSPQARLAAAAAPLLERIRSGDWDGGFYALAKLVAEQKDLDPVLQFILLRRVIEVGRQGSHSLDAALAPLWEQLDKARVDLTANWLVWDDEGTRRSRAQARTALRACEILPECGRHALEVWRQDVAPLPPLPVWVGWLQPEGADEWKCAAAKPLSSGDLYVVASAIGDRPELRQAALRKIGGCNNGEIDWESAAASELVGGRPVYLVAAPETPNKPIAVSATSKEQ